MIYVGCGRIFRLFIFKLFLSLNIIYFWYLSVFILELNFEVVIWEGYEKFIEVVFVVLIFLFVCYFLF